MLPDIRNWFKRNIPPINFPSPQFTFVIAIFAPCVGWPVYLQILYKVYNALISLLDEKCLFYF